MSIWKEIAARTARTYDFLRLVDSRDREDFAQSSSPVQLVCDIDKTYLETEFESILHMARVAFESASSKKTVRGASEVLLAARWGKLNEVPSPSFEPRPLHFVSSSPPQLRNVLEEKLHIDGLDWSSDTFKNQAYNLVKGKVGLLRHHIAYKSAAILKICQRAKTGTTFFFIGDNAERDAYIYLGVKLFVERRLSPNGYRKYLELAEVGQETASSLIAAFASIPEIRVQQILIRNAPGYIFAPLAPLTKPVVQFDNFFQCALFLLKASVIPASGLWELVRSFHNQHGLLKNDIAEELLPLVNDPILGSHAREALQRLDIRVSEAKVIVQSHDMPEFENLTETEILRYATQWNDLIQKQAKRS